MTQPSVPTNSASGFTLLETVVAVGVLVTALTGIAELLAWSVRFAREARERDAALVAAQAKLEWLRAAAFSFDAAGSPVTDPAFASSPTDALERNVEGFSDRINHGRIALLRRWSLVPIDHAPPDATAIEVCAFHAVDPEPTLPMALACVATVRTRQP